MEGLDRTEDGRYVVVGGRRWRASDPLLPAPVRERLVSHLMSARRAVGSAVRSGGTDAEAAARERVRRAKTGLGERGAPWWELSAAERRTRWEAALRALQADAGDRG